jgi:hypothetical protein
VNHLLILKDIKHLNKVTKKKKKESISTLKSKLWDIFTLYIKRKYADGDYCECFTCKTTVKIGTSNCQGGHWLPKKGYSYHYFNENNVRVQCFHCNINLSGNSAVFERELIKEISKEKVEQIYNTRHLSEKRDAFWYKEKIEYYKNL